MDQVGYWEAYYAERRADQALVPSQFAAFLASEMAGRIDGILDVGCGNGRDTLFFSGLGYRAVGIDSSSRAIELCEQRRTALPPAERNRMQFINAAVSETGVSAGLEQLLALGAERIAVYARFFLHAVGESVEAELLRSVAEAGPEVVLLAAEFRTHLDRDLAKVTPDHYRRFIEPVALLRRAEDSGYIVEYAVEGLGLAKFRTDDAHVSRVLLAPRRR